jgi:hypothetical protein
MIAGSLFRFSRGGPAAGPRSFSAAAWLRAVALMTIVWCLAAAAHGQETEEERGQRLMRTHPRALAQAFLGNEYTLTLLGWAKQGATLHLADADGVIVVTPANADNMIAEHKYRRDLYARTIRARGYRDLAGDYQMTVARACEWGDDHRRPQLMTIGQDEFRLTMAAHGVPEEHGFSGIAVDDAVVFATDDPGMYFVGRLRRDRIELRNSEYSKCTLMLARVGGARGAR